MINLLNEIMVKWKNKKIILSNNFWDKVLDIIFSIYVLIVSVYLWTLGAIALYQNKTFKLKSTMNVHPYITILIIIALSILVTIIFYMFLFPPLENFINKIVNFLDYKNNLPHKKHSVISGIIFLIIAPFIIGILGWQFILNRIYEFNMNLYWEVSSYDLMSYIIPLITVIIAAVTYFNTKHANLSIVVNASKSIQFSKFIKVLVPEEGKVTLNIWCNNVGGRTGTFKFMGVVSWKEIKKINATHRVNELPQKLGNYTECNFDWQSLQTGEKEKDNVVTLDLTSQNDAIELNSYVYALYTDSEKIPYFYPIYLAPLTYSLKELADKSKYSEETITKYLKSKNKYIGKKGYSPEILEELNGMDFSAERIEKMKKRKIILIALGSGVIGSLFVIFLFNKTQGMGSMADWVGGLATSFALIFAYAEIKISREQFKKEHQPKLMVYTGWKDSLFLKKNKIKSYDRKLDLPGVQLHIIPVNKGLATGIYRYLGICRRKDLNEVSSLIKKAQNNNIDIEGIDRLANLICYDPADVGQNDKNYDGTGMSLLYPDNNELFQTIESSHVGKIINKKQEDIVNKLGINVYKDVLEVIYIDPNMNIYPFEVKTYKKPKSTVEISGIE